MEVVDGVGCRQTMKIERSLKRGLYLVAFSHGFQETTQWFRLLIKDPDDVSNIYRIWKSRRDQEDKG